jgi:hypothetical protein
MARFAFLATCLTASLSAQVYTSGPFRTADTGGGAGGTSPISVLQTAAPLTHTVIGFGAQQGTIRNALVEDFQVSTFLQISEIELFGYTTGATAPSCTGVYVAIWNADPSVTAPTAPWTTNVLQASSPNPANSPFEATNNRISSTVNTFSGVFRVLDSDLNGTTRQVQSMRINLGANPAVLAPGQYWLEFCFNGVNFVPPITATGVGVTGNAKQFRNATQTYGPIVNGTNNQGIPFRFFGPFGAEGAISNLGGGCSTSTMTVVGAPTVGGFFRAQLANPGTIPAILVGLSPANITLPACGCIQRTSIDLADINTQAFELQIPSVASLAGVSVYVQGAELFASGPCSLPIQSGLTDGFRIRLNLN